MASPSNAFAGVDWVNDNPVLSKEEIGTFRNFFRLFQNEEGLSSVERMTDSLENLVDLNTGVIRKVLLWIRQSNPSPRTFNSHFI
jgi:hypothetical protein